MIKPELYNKTVGILYDAYFNDTLIHGDCCACAVGNIVAAQLGFTVKAQSKEKQWDGDDEIEVCWVNSLGERMPYAGYDWSDAALDHVPMGWGAFTATDGFGLTETDWDNLKNENVKRQIDATGYGPHDIIDIEKAFEKANGESAEERMFNGLVAVLEVLKEIHQVTDEDLLQANNKRFKDHYAKRVSAV